MKRYETEQQIIADIDDAHKKLAALESQVAKLDHGSFEEQRLLVTIGNLKSKRLVYLKQKLGEFRTPQLPTLDNGDRSVPA